MAVQTTKLSEVEVTQSAVDPKLLVEDEGEIKRISPEAITPSQVQVDWEETDTSSPAYILNKPESLSGGGGEVVYYYPASGNLIEEATALMASKATVLNQWNTGARIRIRNAPSGTTFGDVMGVSYSLANGAISGNITLSYISGGSTTIKTVSVTNP